MMFKSPTNLLRNRDSSKTLYFLRCGEFLKIGTTGDLLKRYAQFKIGNPYPIVLEAYRSIPTSMAFQIEFAIHAELAHLAHEGEWFTVSKAEAVKIAHKIITRAIKAEKSYLDQYENRAWDVQDNESEGEAIDLSEQFKEVIHLGKG